VPVRGGAGAGQREAPLALARGSESADLAPQERYAGAADVNPTGSDICGTEFSGIWPVVRAAGGRGRFGRRRSRNPCGRRGGRPDRELHSVRVVNVLQKWVAA